MTAGPTLTMTLFGMALLLAGCSESDRNPVLSGGDPTATGGGDGATGASTGGADDGTGGGSSGGSAGDDGGTKYDVGDGNTGGGGGCMEGGQDCGCTAVDVLFVIDNSISMHSYQQGLAAVAPDFAQAMFDTLPDGTDLHVGVTSSSFWTQGGGSPGETNCRSNGTDAEFLMYYQTPDQVDNGENGGQGRLRVHDGKSYYEITTDQDPAALKTWLQGNIEGVGENGSVFEMIAAGGGWAFDPSNDVANAGFVRDAGAVLVIFALTDEVGNSPEDSKVYHDMVVSKKSACGGDKCVLAGGIMQPCMTTVGGNRLFDFLSSFGEAPSVADIGPELDDCFKDCDKGDITQCDLVTPPVTCAELREGKGTPQYAQALGTALAGVIAETCAEIPPEG